MADRQWFADGIGIHEEGEEEYFVEGIGVNEDQAAPAATVVVNSLFVQQAVTRAATY